MSITDELREYADKLDAAASRKSEHGFSPVAMKLTAIADRIDAEHKRMYADLTVGMEPMTEESMVGHGWVKLPVDADGQVWTGKERVFVADNGSRYDMRYLMYDGNDWLIDSSNGGFPVGCCHHAQPDSWERIITELAERVLRSGHQWGLDASEVKAEFVERCKRLAEVDA